MGMMIVLKGAPDCAPVYLPEEGLPPAWSGKSLYDLSRSDIEAISQFCMDEAFEMGVDEVIDGVPALENPFHPRFMYGVPHATFSTYYGRGRCQAAGSYSVAVQPMLFAAG